MIYRVVSIWMSMTFIFSLVAPPGSIYAQGVAQTIVSLPDPGTMLSTTQKFHPAIIHGLTIHPDNPLRLNFIVDTGDTNLSLDSQEFIDESTRLIKYFLASLTVPEKELWVNLSPYEKDRIISENFGITEMGRDMLAMDYLLKQLTASLMYPEDELGERFWNQVYEQAYKQYGTIDIPINTFNKVWIVPDKGVVHEHENSVFVIDRHLKVMLEEDYLALLKNMGSETFGMDQMAKNDIEDVSRISSDIVKKIIIPAIEHEVNDGKTFANLRQIYNSMILAVWYKKNLRESLLGQVYVDQNKVQGVDVEDKEIKQKIYDQYIRAFKKGVYDYIKEDFDPATQQMIPRKYFSGGVVSFPEERLEIDNSYEAKNRAGSPIGKEGNVEVDLVENGKDSDLPKGVISKKKNGLFQWTKGILAATTVAGLLTVASDSQYISEPIVSGLNKEANIANKTLDQKGYWMNLVYQGKYTEVFQRSIEFVEEPFAFEVLNAALLSYPRGPYSTSSAEALKHFYVYAKHPKALEIAFRALENDGAWRLYGKPFKTIVESPNGHQVVQKALSLDPAAALDQLDPDSPANFQSEGFKEYLQQSNEPIAKVILQIHNAPYDNELKKKIAGLVHNIIHEGLSLEEAVEIVNDPHRHFKELSRIKRQPNFIGTQTIRNSLRWISQDIIQSIQASLSDWNSYTDKDFVEGLSGYEIYILMAHGTNFINKDVRQETVDYLYGRLKKSTKDLDEVKSWFIENDFDTDARNFFRILASYGKLTDFMSFLTNEEINLYFKKFVGGKKLDHSYYNHNILLIENPAVQLIMAKVLLERSGSSAERQYYLNLIEQAKGEINGIKHNNVFFENAGRFRGQGFIRSKIRSVIAAAAENDPSNSFFENAHYFIEEDYGKRAFIKAAHKNPAGAFRSIDSSAVNVKKALQDDKDPLIRKLFEIDKLSVSKENKYKVTLLMEDLLNNNLTFQEAIDIVKDPVQLRARLAEIKSRSGSVGIFAVDQYLSDFYLKTVRQMNNLHNRADEVRFAVINSATVKDIYYLMVYGEQEIYTSTFNGVFDRLLGKMGAKGITGEQLLDEVDYFRFRSFVRLLTGFGRLNEFLSTMEESFQRQLLERFVRGIEKEENYLQQATIVADAFSVIEDEMLLFQLQRLIEEEFDRVTIENHPQGIVLYKILSGLFGERAVINKTWFKKMSDEFGLPRTDKVSVDKLFNQYGENIQRYFFYNGKDGKRSFEHFISFYKNSSQWQVTYKENHIEISSVGKGKKIIMFANKPDKIKKGAEDIEAIFKKRNIFPHVVVHRGHSYYAPETIQQINPEAIIVSLGSCGGFQLVFDVMQRAPNAHVFSTKGTGSMYVNDPLLKMLNNRILNEDDTIRWDEFWSDAEKYITSEYFPQYIPPHRNIGALFLKVYQKEINELNSSSSSLRNAVLSLAFLISLGIPWTAEAADLPSSKLDREYIVDQISLGIMTGNNNPTGIAVSHLGFPGFESTKFTYDAAIDPLVLKASGKQKEAEEDLDFFARALRLAKRQNSRRGIFGIVKTFEGRYGPENVRGLINALNVNSRQPQGQGSKEYKVTPGPNAFMAMSFLGVNTERYLDAAIVLGETLLSMQRSDGAVQAGYYDSQNVYIEPHMDALAVFQQLYEVTGDLKWKIAYDKAWEYFVNSGAYDPKNNQIWPGVHNGWVNRIFATDVYSWTMIGPAGNRMSLSELKGFTETMLKKSLTKVTLELPDGKVKTVILVDFADPQDPRIINARGGFHPMGSVEWTAGVILALQKNAVRFWNSSNPEDKRTAQVYKALAEYLTNQSLNAFYEVPGLDGMFSFYATGQNVPTGHGWNTPLFYFRNRGEIVRGGSLIGSWIALPIKGVNPLILNDPYKKFYDKIPLTNSFKTKASQLIDRMVKGRSFKEKFITTGNKKEKIQSGPKRTSDWEDLNITRWKGWPQGGNPTTIYHDFMPFKQFKKGQKIRITYSLKGGDGMTFQLLPQWADYGSAVNLERISNAGGTNKTIIFEIPETGSYKQIAFHYGSRDARGKIPGGSNNAQLVIHSIEVSSGSSSIDVGGINFDPGLLDLQIKRDGNGNPLPVWDQPVENMNIHGFYPVILNVTPVSLPLLLGLHQSPHPDTVSNTQGTDASKNKTM